MTKEELRDHFAGQALTEFASFVSIREPATYDVVARECYKMADAMIRAKENAGSATDTIGGDE